MVDVNGRTPLHYAATLADNGHYYNLLVHLGADTRIQDKVSTKIQFQNTNYNCSLISLDILRIIIVHIKTNSHTIYF